jgi:hypothetical protein
MTNGCFRFICFAPTFVEAGRLAERRPRLEDGLGRLAALEG